MVNNGTEENLLDGNGNPLREGWYVHKLIGSEKKFERACYISLERGEFIEHTSFPFQGGHFINEYYLRDRKYYPINPDEFASDLEKRGFKLITIEVMRLIKEAQFIRSLKRNLEFPIINEEDMGKENEPSK